MVRIQSPLKDNQKCPGYSFHESKFPSADTLSVLLKAYSLEIFKVPLDSNLVSWSQILSSDDFFWMGADEITWMKSHFSLRPAFIHQVASSSLGLETAQNCNWFLDYRNQFPCRIQLLWSIDFIASLPTEVPPLPKPRPSYAPPPNLQKFPRPELPTLFSESFPFY